MTMECFAVGRDGVAVRLVGVEASVSLMGISPSLSAGYDLLADDGMDPDRIASLLMAAEKQGKDPETFARHMLKLRRAARS